MTILLRLCYGNTSQLGPSKIGKKRNLVEWFGDWEDEDPQHRHVSHLFALHPGREILPLLDTAYAAACRKLLEIQGDGGTCLQQSLQNQLLGPPAEW